MQSMHSLLNEPLEGSSWRIVLDEFWGVLEISESYLLAMVNWNAGEEVGRTMVDVRSGLPSPWLGLFFINTVFSLANLAGVVDLSTFHPSPCPSVFLACVI